MVIFLAWVGGITLSLLALAVIVILLARFVQPERDEPDFMTRYRRGDFEGS